MTPTSPTPPLLSQCSYGTHLQVILKCGETKFTQQEEAHPQETRPHLPSYLRPYVD